MASAPHRSHVFTVANFDQIRSVQKQLVAQLCAGVDEQLSAIVSGEEGEGRDHAASKPPEQPFLIELWFFASGNAGVRCR